MGDGRESGERGHVPGRRSGHDGTARDTSSSVPGRTALTDIFSAPDAQAQSARGVEPTSKPAPNSVTGGPEQWPPPTGPLLPDLATKDTARWESKKKEISVKGLKISFTIRGEVSAKDDGEAASIKSKGGTAKANVGSAQNIIDRNADGWDARITAALMKGSASLLEGRLPDELAFLSLDIETKALEASVGVQKGFDLKLLSMAFQVGGSLKPFLPPELRDHAEVKLAVRGELALGGDIAKQLVELSRSADDIAKALEFEETLGKQEQRLARASRMANVPEAELEKLHPRVANAHRAARAELRALQREVDKLRGLRGKMSELGRRGIARAQAASAKLASSGAGKLVSKLGGKLLVRGLKKFIPVYGLVSSLQDLHEVAQFFASVPWSRLAEKVWNREDPGTGRSGGAVDGPQTRGDADATGERLEGEGAIPASEFERTLDERASGKLHTAAAEIVDALSTSSRGGVTLSADDRATIDHFVPKDLSQAELSMIKQRLLVTTGEAQDLVDAVIDAVGEVRPFGEKASVDEQAKAPAPEPAEIKKNGEATRSTKRKSATNRPANNSRQRDHVDPTEVLRKSVKFDQQGKLVRPQVVEFDGVLAEVTQFTLWMHLTASDDTTREVHATLRVRAAPRGARLADGTELSPGHTFPVILTVEIPPTPKRM